MYFNKIKMSLLRTIFFTNYYLAKLSKIVYVPIVSNIQIKICSFLVINIIIMLIVSYLIVDSYGKVINK